MREIINAFLIPAALTLLAFAAGCDKKDKYLRADPPSLEFDAQAQSETVTIESSSSWYPTPGAAWLEAYQDTDNPSLLHVVIAEANESLSSREGEISVISGDALQIYIRVLQNALDAAFEVTPSALEFDGRGTLPQTLTVTARNVPEWTFNNFEKDWLTVTRGEGAEENILTVRAAFWDQFMPRRDTIVIAVPRDGFEAINDTIPVVQLGINLVLLDAAGGVIEDVFEIAAGVTEIEFGIASAYDWTLTVPDGVTASAVSGEADTSGETELHITVPENTGTEAVEYVITFECGGESYPFTIIQSAPGGEEPLP